MTKENFTCSRERRRAVSWSIVVYFSNFYTKCEHQPCLQVARQVYSACTTDMLNSFIKQLSSKLRLEKNIFVAHF